MSKMYCILRRHITFNTVLIKYIQQDTFGEPDTCILGDPAKFWDQGAGGGGIPPDPRASPTLDINVQ